MSGVERDIQCGNSFAQLYDLGCFDEEFMVYGCAYREAGKMKYFISSHGEKVYLFKDEAIFDAILTTPVQRKIVRLPVASGEREQIKLRIKLELAKELQAAYAGDYFERLQKWSSARVSDRAYDLLLREQETINGYFVPERVQLFRGMCKMALESKSLSRERYRPFADWLQYAKRQMENEVFVQGKFRRQFYGFGFKMEGTIHYVFDAHLINVYQKRDQLLADGQLVSPIISKVYGLKMLNQLPEVRKKFHALLEQYVDDVLMEKLETLCSLSPPIEQQFID